MITPARSCASAVEPARCGVTTTCVEARAAVPEYGSVREDVERGARDLARADRVDERVLVDQPAARGVDDAHAVPHPRERRGVEQPPRLVVEREVERDDVGLPRRRPPSVAAGSTPSSRKRSTTTNGSYATTRIPSPSARLRDLPPDPPEPEHAERLAGELDAGEPLPVPRAGLSAACACGTFRASARSSAIACSAAEIDRRLGGVRDDDAAPRRGVDVDVVDTDSGACRSP